MISALYTPLLFMLLISCRFHIYITIIIYILKNVNIIYNKCNIFIFKRKFFFLQSTCSTNRFHRRIL